MLREIRELGDDIGKLADLPDAIQQAFWMGEETGRNSRDREVKHLLEALDDVMRERNELLEKLEPYFAWRTWLESNKDESQGFPFIDLMGGER
jgi:hypothetical protein